MDTQLYPSQIVFQAYAQRAIREAIDRVLVITGDDVNARDFAEAWIQSTIAGWESDIPVVQNPNQDQIAMLIQRVTAMQYGQAFIRRLTRLRVRQIRARMLQPDHPWHGMQLEAYPDEDTEQDQKLSVYLNAGTLSDAPLADRVNPLLGSESATTPLPGNDD